MRKSLLGVFVIGLLLAADEKKPEDLKDKLKGVWNVVSMEADGKKAPDEEFKGDTLTFEGDKATHEHKGKKEPATFKLDATKKPAQLDIMPTDGPEKGMTIKMILQLDGDTLKIAAGNGPTAERPKSFDDKNIMIITVKRAKK
jgi:uncharacterized protein (TIGR03067 family)